MAVIKRFDDIFLINTYIQYYNHQKQSICKGSDGLFHDAIRLEGSVRYKGS